MEEYAISAEKIYTIGGKSFLTSSNDVGKEEDFYMDVLRFCIPHIAKMTYEKHGLGVGILLCRDLNAETKRVKIPSDGSQIRREM